MLKRLDGYLLTYFFMSLIVVVAAIGFTIVVINMVEELRNFLDKDVPFVKILEYYYYFSGWILKSFFPVFVLLASLFSISILARKNEILAMKAAGISLYRVAYPLLAVALLMSVGHFYYNEYVYPEANRRRLEIKEFTIRARSKRTYTKRTNVYRQVRAGYFYSIGTFYIDRQEGKDIKIYKSTDNRLDEITTANRMIYKDNYWVALDGIVRTYSDSGGEAFSNFDSLVLRDIKEKPSDFAKRVGKPEDMGLDDLSDYIDLMKRTGGPYQRESIDLQTKYSYPLASFLVVLISVPLASNPRRGGVAVSFATGAGIALMYFVIFKVMLSAGYNAKIPDLVAVWGVNGLFLLVGITVLCSVRK